MTQTRIAIIGDSAATQPRCKALERREDVAIVATCAAAPSGGETEPAAWQTLLARDDLDAVIVSSCPRDMPAIIIAALGRGLHVLCDCPPGRTLEDIINIRQAENAAPGSVLKFSLNQRHHQSVSAAKKIADSGDLGRLLFMRGIYGRAGGGNTGGDDYARFGGGILIDLGFDMLDLMQMFAGPFEEVKALVDELSGHGHGLEDNVMALLRTHGGVMAMVHASSTQWRQTFRLEIGFEQGYIWLDGRVCETGDFAPEVLITGTLKRGDDQRPIANPTEDIRQFRRDESSDMEIAEFLAALDGTAPVRTGTSQQVFDAMNVVQRIYAADHTFIPGAPKA